MDSLEKFFDDMLVKKAPFQIPEKARKWIAEYAWIFALIGLVIGIFGFLSLLSLLGLFSVFIAAVGGTGYVALAWLSLIVLGCYLLVLGISIPKLKAKQLLGWKLTYYSLLFFVVYSVLDFFAQPHTAAFFGFVWDVIWIVVALYVLFQVRGHFTGDLSKKTSPKK